MRRHKTLNAATSISSSIKKIITKEHIYLFLIIYNLNGIMIYLKTKSQNIEYLQEYFNLYLLLDGPIGSKVIETWIFMTIFYFRIFC